MWLIIIESLIFLAMLVLIFINEKQNSNLIDFLIEWKKDLYDINVKYLEELDKSYLKVKKLYSKVDNSEDIELI